MNFSLFPLSRKFANSLISLFIISLWTVAILLVANTGEEDTENLGLAIFTYYTLFAGLGLGLISSTVRILGFIKNPANFVYNFSGVLNCCLGLLGAFLALTNQVDEPWVLLFMFSLIMGFIIMIDVIISGTVPR